MNKFLGMLALGGALLAAPATQAEKINGEKAAALRCSTMYNNLSESLYSYSLYTFPDGSRMSKKGTRKTELLANSYKDKAVVLYALTTGFSHGPTQEESDFVNEYNEQAHEDDNLRIKTFRTCEKMFPFRLPPHRPLDLSDLLSLE